MGLDPSKEVEIFLAKGVAGRVEGLVGMLVPSLIGSGLKERIEELEAEYGKGNEEIGLIIANEVAEKKFCDFESEEQAIEAGMRAGIAYWTLGIVTAPLEGLTHVKIKKRKDGGRYLALYFAGPIRSAGGTTNAMIVLLGDFMRKKFGLQEYDPTNNEAERYYLEVEDYHKRITRLQYFPSKQELLEIVNHMPVEVTGESTEKLEVLAFKDLERVETNAIRGGMVLTLSMLALKAPKILKRLKKWDKKYNLENWKWLKTLIEYKKNQSKKGSSGAVYLAEIPGGRPVFGYPDRIGGFRLVYGRARNTGFASVGVHPATIVISDSFLAMGAQLKMGIPGKAGAVAPVDSIEGPIVRLKNGDVVKVNTVEQAKLLVDRVDKILYLGDILISYGEFLTNGKALKPSAWVREWWLKEVQAHDPEWSEMKVALDEAIQISKKFNIPLHPDYSFYWESLSIDDVKRLKDALGSNKEAVDWKSVKDILENLGVEHQVKEGAVVVGENDEKIIRLVLSGELPSEMPETAIDLVNLLSPVKIQKKAGKWIGARMGRPEKAEKRAMKGSPHSLFPSGRISRLRNIVEALNGRTLADLAFRVCPKCERRTYYLMCPVCNVETVQKYKCIRCGATTDQKVHCGLPTRAYESIFLKENLEEICQRMGVVVPPVLKGVRGISSNTKIPEKLEKGVLRCKYELTVNKDGTIRVDSTDMPLTHFKPKEIGTSVEKLRELGYATDKDGRPLKSDEQLVEIMPQDVIISDDVSFSSADYLVRVSAFIDDLLVKFYGLEPFYKVNNKKDLIGHLVIGLAPHTSAGIVGRIIGFSPVRSGLAHPIWHAAKKRNCDGDEDSVILLMDGLLNFSREFLPDSRGGKTMDVPLVLTTHLNLLEVDDEVHDMDVVAEYPLEFYRATLEEKYPWEIPLKTVGKLDVENPTGIHFTQSTTNIAAGPMMTSYKTLGAMSEKVKKQLELATKIRAVDENDVASKILDSHFIKDIKGNLRRFHTQTFRCLGCNEKFRRPPLLGKCPKCGGRITQTVYEGTIKKYLDASLKLARKFNVSNYIQNQLQVVEKRTNMTFGGDKQEDLNTWFK